MALTILPHLCKMEAVKVMPGALQVMSRRILSTSQSNSDQKKDELEGYYAKKPFNTPSFCLCTLETTNCTHN